MPEYKSVGGKWEPISQEAPVTKATVSKPEAVKVPTPAPTPKKKPKR